MPLFTLPRSIRTTRNSYLAPDSSSSYEPLRDHPASGDHPTPASDSISSLHLDGTARRPGNERSTSIDAQPQPQSRRRRIFGEELCRWYESCSLRERGGRSNGALEKGRLLQEDVEDARGRTEAPLGREGEETLSGVALEEARPGQLVLDEAPSGSNAMRDEAVHSSTRNQQAMDDASGHVASACAAVEAKRAAMLADCVPGNHLRNVSNASAHAQAAAAVLSVPKEEREDREERERLEKLNRLGHQMKSVIVFEKGPHPMMSRVDRQVDDAATLRPEDSITLRGEAASHVSAGNADAETIHPDDSASQYVPGMRFPQPVGGSVRQRSAVSGMNWRTEFHGKVITMSAKCIVEVENTKDKQISVRDHADIEVFNARDINIVNYKAVRVNVRNSYRIKIFNIRDARCKVTVQDSEKVSVRHLGLAEEERNAGAIKTQQIGPNDDDCHERKDSDPFKDPDEKAPPKMRKIPKRYRLTKERREAGCYHEGDVDVQLFTESLEDLPLDSFDKFVPGNSRQDSGCFQFMGLGAGPGPAMTDYDDPLGWVPLQTLRSNDGPHKRLVSSWSDSSTVLPANDDSDPDPWATRVYGEPEGSSLDIPAAPRIFCPYGSDHSVGRKPAGAGPHLDEPPFPVWLLDLLEIAIIPRSRLSTDPLDILASSGASLWESHELLLDQDRLRAEACDSPGPEEYMGE